MAQLKKFLILFIVLFSLIGGYIFFVLPTKIVPIVQQIISENSNYQFSADKFATIKFSLTPQIHISRIKLVKDEEEINIKQAIFTFNLKEWAQNHFSTQNMPIEKIVLFHTQNEVFSFPDITLTKADSDSYYILTKGTYYYTEYNLSGFIKKDLTFSFDITGNNSTSNLTGKYENDQLTGILKLKKDGFPKKASTSVKAEIAGPLKHLSVPTFQANITTYQFKQVMTISGDIKSFKPFNANFSFNGNYDKYSASGLVSVNDKLFDLSQLKMKLDHTILENADVKIDLTHTPEFKANILADTLNLKELAGTINFVQNSIKNILGPKDKSLAPESTDQISRDQTSRGNSEQKNYFDIQKFKSANGNIIIHANQVISNLEKKLGSAEIKVELKNGILDIPVFNIGYCLQGKASAKVIDDKSINAKLQIKAQSLPLGTFVKNITAGTVSGVIDLETTSDTKEGLMQNAQGFIKLAGQNIAYKTKLKLLKKLTGFKGSNEIVLNCGVINTPIRDGVMISTKKIAFETKKQQILLDGKIDLGHQEYDIDLNVDQNELDLGTLLTEISITGPFSTPHIKVNHDKALDKLFVFGMKAFESRWQKIDVKPPARKLNNVCQKALQ